MNVAADSSSDCFSREEIIINAPAEGVFKILSDINYWPEWQSNVTKAEIKGATEVGRKFKWKAGGMNINSQLHTVSQGSELGWTGRILWISAIHNWYLFQEANKTRVVVEESLKGFGSALMKKSLIEGMKQNLAELKKEAERG